MTTRTGFGLLSAGLSARPLIVNYQYQHHNDSLTKSLVQGRSVWTYSVATVGFLAEATWFVWKLPRLLDKLLPAIKMARHQYGDDGGGKMDYWP